MTNARRPTIADVARAAAVDPSVVSKVLSGDPKLQVREATRERVRTAAAELGYVPNHNARRLRSSAGAIGLLIQDFRTPGNAEIVSGAEETAAARGTLLWTASLDGSPPDGNLSLFRSGVVDALLVAGLGASRDHAAMAASGLPLLMVNHRVPGLDRWLVLEDDRAAAVATEQLIAAGHRRIGFIGGYQHFHWDGQRHAGYLAALARAGIEADPRLEAFVDLTPEGGADGVAQILAGGTEVTALVVSHGNVCLGAWNALRARGIGVPQDLSLIAITRMPHEALRTPALSRVELPLRAIGGRAVELLLDTPPTAPITEVLVGPVTFVEGDTVGPPARS